ncbi:MAG TPA: alpha/beta hydrolase fold domain-containing protein [Puia sp.]|nr:alpha/beta hydrolase fold domain-containing protein [Puia sp.]
MTVAGDSAGGTLATDSSLATPSWAAFAEGPVVTVKSAIELWAYYTDDKIGAAPIYNDDLSGMPNAFIITAEYDPLRDEAIAYAKKLRAAGVRVTERLYPKMIHGFFQFGGVINEGREAIAAVAEYIQYRSQSAATRQQL